MSIGYWIVKGDKTSCGGSVLEGHPKGTQFGPNQNRQAVNGNKVSCGKHPGIYSVDGGHPGEIIHGCYAASTLYSRSTCPCKAFFIPTHTWAKHGLYQGGMPKAAPVAAPLVAAAPSPEPAKADEPVQHAQTAKKHNDFAKTCTPEDNPLRDGVYVWVEVQEAGHAFVSVHQSNQIYVYTYGRYGRIGTAGLTGDGILLFMRGDDARLYYREELYQREAEVYRINDVGLFSARDAFQKLWNSGTKPVVTKDMGDRTKRNGRVIDEYDLTGSNCTTHTVNAISEAGSHIFDTRYVSTTTGIPIEGHEDFTIPTSLKKYLSEKSNDLSSMDIINVTDEFKVQYPNINGFTPSKSDLRGKSFEAATEGLSEAGSSTGYSAGSIGGLSGGSYDVE